ncbi:S8 family serine peptidase [Desulfopila sp. IMCC35006]|uniref:S8 family serine peptidase n=1 Tax=Desulfopila sp. IMCC35006 TaxID=2569542 RepID=UPI00142EC620|nr:S8 family serine peptidase [Desulfopila sp. IMCC35006]
MVRRSLVAVIGILLVPLVLSAASLRIEGDRAWLKADDVPLPKVLQLFEQRGVEVLVDPSLTLHRISGDWKNAEVGRLIAQLASPHSYMLEWRSEKSPLGDLFQISSIRIFSDGKQSVACRLSPQGKVLDVVEGENGVQYIRGEIMVGFNQESSIDDLKALLSRLNGTVIEVIDPPGLYRIKLNDDMSVEEAIRIAQAHGGVAATEPNLAFPTIASNILPLTGIAEGINLNLLPGETAIAVFDSGLDPAYADSPFIRGTYDALDPTAEISDPTGHGTLTSLIAAGAITPLGAKAAESGVPVLSVRTLDKNGMTSSDTIMRALEYAVNSGVKIISMSWGSEVRSQFLENTMNFAAQNGMRLYAAAGNEPTGTPVYPAGYSSVIAVGGLNPDGSQWENTNYGNFVERYEPALANFNDLSYAGTSVASPYAAFKAARGVSE